MDKRQRETSRILRKIEVAMSRDKGVWLSSWELNRLAVLVNNQSERAYSAEIMLHTMAMRVNGQASTAIH